MAESTLRGSGFSEYAAGTAASVCTRAWAWERWEEALKTDRWKEGTLDAGSGGGGARVRKRRG